MKKKRPENEKISLIKSIINPIPSTIDILTPKGFLQDLIHRIRNVDMSGMGAQLAYFLLLSLFPMLIFLMTLIPYLNLHQEDVFDFLAGVVPDEVYILIENTLGEVLTNQNGGLLSIGILGTIWSASRGVDGLMRGLNRAYDVDGRAGIKRRFLSFVFTIALVMIILIALVFPVFGHHISNIIVSHFGVTESFESLWTFIRWITPPALIVATLMGMYWIVPNTDPRLKFISAFPGAIFSTLGWLGLTYGFSFYINNFGNYSATYGSIGGVIILMLWLYFTGMIIIFGGLLNATIHRRQLAKLTKATNK